MTDVPAAAIAAAHAAIACNVGDPGWAEKLKLSPHDLADIALEAAAPHITAAAAAAERQRIRTVIEDEYGPTLARELCRRLLTEGDTT